MSNRYSCGLLMVLFSCTDLGVIGERARSNAGASGELNAGTGGQQNTGARAAAASGGSECLFGICDLPPFCTKPGALCIFCESDADCTHDPVEHFCSPVFSTCVACLSDADCGPGAPYCDGGECGLCNDDDQCSDDEKCKDGNCESD